MLTSRIYQPGGTRRRRCRRGLHWSGDRVGAPARRGQSARGPRRGGGGVGGRRAHPARKVTIRDYEVTQCKFRVIGDGRPLWESGPLKCSRRSHRPDGPSFSWLIPGQGRHWQFAQNRREGGGTRGMSSAGLFPPHKEVLNLVEVFETAQLARAIERFIN